MSVELEPSELGFRRPFTYEVTQLLRLKNPGKYPVAFKVKTTAPKQYCVRPNSGRIEPASEVEVQVLLQAMREDPPPEARCRDKFLVQSIAITPEREMPNVAAIWQNVEKISKDDIQERKIRVVFLPSDSSRTAFDVNGAHDDAPPAYGSPAPSFGSPGSNAVTPSYRGNNAPNEAEFPAEPYPTEKSVHDDQEPATTMSSRFQSTLEGAASSVANAVPVSSEDLKAQLAEAKAMISKLTQQSEEQDIRQKKGDAVNQDSRERITTGMSGMGIQQQPADGVPVQIVAALCLLSFLLAYFFF